MALFRWHHDQLSKEKQEPRHGKFIPGPTQQRAFRETSGDPCRAIDVMQFTFAHKPRPAGLADMDTVPEQFAGKIQTCTVQDVLAAPTPRIPLDVNASRLQRACPRE